MKRCSTLLIIRKMQIKTTMRHHFTPNSMAIIKKKKKRKKGNNKFRQGYRQIGILVHCMWEMIQLLWETVWWFLKKLNKEWSI